MTNIATLLKNEIARVARKEVRAEMQSLKKAAATYRTEIAALKRRAEVLEKELRRLKKGGAKAVAANSVGEGPNPNRRFSAKGLATQRHRLGLSAADCGLLVGASALSVYKWESGKGSPRAKFLDSIASLKSMGKKDAAARLAALR